MNTRRAGLIAGDMQDSVMRWIYHAACCVMMGLSFAGCASDSGIPRNFSIVEPTPAEGDLAPILKAEAAKAREQGRKPFVELGSKSCGPCIALKKAFADPLMIEALNGTYLIQLDVDEWTEQLRSAGLVVDAIPAFHELDGEGRPTGRNINGGDWGDSTAVNAAPILQRFFSGE